MNIQALKPEADWLAAFADPTRIAILRLLATGEHTVSVMARELNIEIVNISHHLGVMRGAGVVKCERDGRFMRYTLLGAKATATALELSHPSGMRMILPLN